MQKAVIIFLALMLASPVLADGPLPNLSDPPVRPIIRDVGQEAAGGAPLTITGVPMGDRPVTGQFGFCNNGQRSGTPPDAYGYDVTIACDAVLIGGGILGAMYMLGAAAATE